MNPLKNLSFGALLKSKTVWGAICGAGSYLAAQPRIGPAEIIQAGAVVLSAIGVRDAIEGR